MSDEVPANALSDAPAVRRRGCRGARWLALLVASVLVGCCLLALLLLTWDRLLPPTSAADLHANLTTRLAEAERLWADLDDLWGRLEAGATLSCQQEQVTRPYFIAWRHADRAAYPALADLADQLNGGLRRLHEAADRWSESCQRATTDLSHGQVTAARQSLEQARLIFDVVSAALATTP